MRRKISALLLAAALSSGTVVITAHTLGGGRPGAVKEAGSGFAGAPPASVRPTPQQPASASPRIATRA